MTGGGAHCLIEAYVNKGAGGRVGGGDDAFPPRPPLHCAHVVRGVHRRQKPAKPQVPVEGHQHPARRGPTLPRDAQFTTQRRAA